jgi:hypothetical protein
MNSVLSGFSNGFRRLSFTQPLEPKPMFAFDRSALAVLVPLALLLAVVVYSNRSSSAEPQVQAHESGQAAHQDQTVAANLPSR